MLVHLLGEEGGRRRESWRSCNKPLHLDVPVPYGAHNTTFEERVVVADNHAELRNILVSY